VASILKDVSAFGEEQFGHFLEKFPRFLEESGTGAAVPESALACPAGPGRVLPCQERFLLENYKFVH
jgi:hypothetical protein